VALARNVSLLLRRPAEGQLTGIIGRVKSKAGNRTTARVVADMPFDCQDHIKEGTSPSIFTATC
jgi:hypothetical protein